MFWHDGHTRAKVYEEWSIDHRSLYLDRQVIHLGDFKFFAVNYKTVAGDIINFRIINNLVPGEDHVVCREWRAVTPAQIFPEVKRPGFAVGRIGPGIRQPRFYLLRG